MKYQALAALAVCIFFAASFAGIQQGHIVYSYHRSAYTEPPEGGGVWLGSSSESKPKLLWGSRSTPVDGAYFSPDGKRIAFSYGDSLYLMNNDGANVQSYWPGPNWPPNIPNDKNASQWDGWQYTENGIFWVANKKIHRYIIEENRFYTLALDHDIIFRRQLRMDKAGTKGVWLEPADYKGMRAFELSSDLKSISFRVFAPVEEQHKAAKPGCGMWGHGNCMSIDGALVIQNSWCCQIPKTPCSGQTTHNFMNVYTFGDGDRVIKSICYGLYYPHSVNKDNVVQDYFGNYNWDVPEPVLNHKDYIITGTGNQNVQKSFHFYITNLSDPNDYVEVPGPHMPDAGGGWFGPLPSPSSTTPFISLDKTNIRLDASTSSAAVTVSNTGGGTLAKPTVALSPSDYSWLSTSIAAANGDSWNITASIDKGAMPDGEYAVTATVSGGGASSSTAFNITAIKGDVLASPDGLAAQNTGTQNQDVTLSWTDNSSGEEGFTIERKQFGGNWVSVETTVADKTSYVDANVAPDTYAYRVQAFKGSTNSVWSNEASVKVTGAMSIAVTAPSPGTQLIAGKPYAIKWTENGVTNVKIEYSVDEGVSWIPVTEKGGIVSGQDTWGNYPWVVPDISGSILLKVAQYDDEVVTIVKELTVNNSASIINRQHRIAQKDIQSIEIFSVSGRLIARYEVQAFDMHSIKHALPANASIAYVRYKMRNGHILKKQIMIR